MRNLGIHCLNNLQEYHMPVLTIVITSSVYRVYICDVASVLSTGQIADLNVDLKASKVLCEPYNKLTLTVWYNKLSIHSGSSRWW